MNLFDYTYCGNYNRQIQNLSRIVPEKWSFGSTEDNGILKGYLEHTFHILFFLFLLSGVRKALLPNKG